MDIYSYEYGKRKFLLSFFSHWQELLCWEKKRVSLLDTGFLKEVGASPGNTRKGVHFEGSTEEQIVGVRHLRDCFTKKRKFKNQGSD